MIVGKRALPALALAGEGGPLDAQVELAAEPRRHRDRLRRTRRGRARGCARERGCLTLAFARGGRRVGVRAAVARTPSIRQELVETLYHVLWELVHVFFDHRGLLEGREARQVHDTGASSFLYPFLGEQRARPRGGRRRTCAARCSRRPTRSASCARRRSASNARRAAGRRRGAARRPRRGRPRCSRSATAARPPTRWTWWPTSAARPTRAGRRGAAIDLTEDAAILTAIANDIGTEAIFSRQVIAHGRAGDTLLAISTSGNSANVIAGARGGAPARAAHDRDGRLRRRPGGRRAAGGPRGGHALRAHPAHPGGAGKRVPRAAGAGRREPRPRRASREPCRGSASGRTCTGWPASWEWPGTC